MNLWPYIFVAAGLVLGGALVAFMAFLPPVRRWSQRSSITRAMTVFLLGLAALALGFGVWTRLTAETVYVFGTLVSYDTFNPRSGGVFWPQEEIKPALVNELWLHLLVPPPLRQTCYTSQAEVCAVSNDLLAQAARNRGWADYLRDVAVGWLSSLVCAGLAWRFTRPARSWPPAA